MEEYYHRFRLALFDLQNEGPFYFLERVYYEIRIRRYTHGSPSKSAWLYHQWMNKYRPGFFRLLQRRRASKQWPNPPLITIIVFIENLTSDRVQQTIRSVNKQSYSNWELCLIVGTRDNTNIRTGNRTRIFTAQNDKTQIDQLNLAIDNVLGDYLVFLGCGDVLAPHALYEIAQKINHDPYIDVVYFDEDKIGFDSHIRSNPWFKPTISSPDLFLSTNYWIHSVIRRSLVRAVGKFDVQMDGAHEWDLSLRLMERDPKSIHIPDVLYHSLKVTESESIDSAAYLQTIIAQKRCLENHLKRVESREVVVDVPHADSTRVHWPVTGSLVTILIPTKDNVHILQACLTSILDLTTYPNYEIILIDTGSVKDGTIDYYAKIREDARIRIVHYQGVFNFHKVNNFGVQFAQGKNFVFLNNDTEVLSPDWLTELVGWVERKGVGIVGAKLIRPDGTIQHAGLVMGLAGHGSHAFDGAVENQSGPFGSPEWYRDYQAVTGACMCVRREVFEELHGFDEIYQVGYGDIDFCLRAVDLGYRVVYTPFARLIHHEGASRKFSQPPADVLRASVRMYPRIIWGDPYFNPNLSTLQRIPSVREPLNVRRDRILHKIHTDFDLIEIPLTKSPLGSTWLVQQDGNKVGSGSSCRAMIITHSLSLSGAPIILLEVARELKEQGYEVMVVSPSDGPLSQFCQTHGLTLRLIPNVLKDARTVLWLLRDYDFIIANTVLAFRAIHAARAFNKPSFWWIHESQFGKEMAVKYPGIAMAFDQASAVIFPAGTTADLYRSFTRNNNFFVLHNGVKEPVLNAVESTFSTNQNKVKIVIVGSIEYRKGQDVLLDALDLLSSTDREKFEVLMVGRMIDWAEPDFCNKVTKKARDLGIVRLTGSLPSDQVGAYLRDADIFVLPSRDEVLPLSVIEAMSLGKAVICTRVGGVEEIIDDGVDGLLVNSQDPSALAASLLELTNIDLRVSLGQNARKKYQESLTPEIFYRQMMALIDKVLQSNWSKDPDELR